MTELEIFIPGTPRPQGSKRHVGGGRMIEQSKHLKAWRNTVTLIARTKHNGPPIEGPITVHAIFIFPRAKALKDKTAPPHISAPDADKLQRAIGDALTESQAINDDAQINVWHVHKRRACPGEDAGALITVSKTQSDMVRWNAKAAPGVREHSTGA